MDVIEQSLKLHKDKHGAIEVIGTMPLLNGDDLALAYTPGVAGPCMEIARDNEKAYDYTIKGKTVAVITNGTAVLGLGNIGPLAGLPVVEGKALLLKRFAGIDAIPLCVDSSVPDEIVNTIRNISLGFGGIHLEDIKAPECFYIEDQLKEKLDIPVYHDDQHGTAIAVLAGLYNALKIVKKDLEEVKIVINGAGASGIATAKLLFFAGAKNIVLCDIGGILDQEDASLNGPQREIAGVINQNKESGQLADAMKAADVLIGVSDGNTVTEEMVASMNKDGIVFALANPVPEIMPEAAHRAGARITATGRSDFANQINNVLVFPGMFKGVLESRVKDITDEMKICAAKSIAAIVSEEELTEQYIVPSVFNEKVSLAVAEAVKNNEKSKIG